MSDHAKLVKLLWELEDAMENTVDEDDVVTPWLLIGCCNALLNLERRPDRERACSEGAHADMMDAWQTGYNAGKTYMGDS